MAPELHPAARRQRPASDRLLDVAAVTIWVVGTVVAIPFALAIAAAEWLEKQEARP